MYQIKARGRLRSKNYLGRINLVRRYWHLKYSERPCRRAGKSGVSRLLLYIILHALARRLFLPSPERAEIAFTAISTLYLLGRDVTRLRHWPTTLFLQHPPSSGGSPRPTVDQIQIHRQKMVIVILYLVNFACEQPFVLNTSDPIATECM